MKEEDFRAHESKSCISEGYVLGDKRRPKLFTSQQYCKNQAEMSELFSDIPSALKNSVNIAYRCNFGFDLGKNYLPNFPIPNNIKIEDYLLKEAIQIGIYQRVNYKEQPIDYCGMEINNTPLNME